jgi:hypothetical protein
MTLQSSLVGMCPQIVSRGSVVGTAVGCGLGDRRVGVRVPVGSRILTSPYRPDRLWGPPNLVSNGYRGLKRKGLEVDLSSASLEVEPSPLLPRLLKTKLRGLGPRANYTDRATAACRRSQCQLLRIPGATWSA